MCSFLRHHGRKICQNAQLAVLLLARQLAETQRPQQSRVLGSVFHESSGGGRSELGLAWELVSDPSLLAGWGRYAVLAEYTLAGAGFDGQLLAGRDADTDRTAPSDLQLGADIDWEPRAALGRAVITAHIRDTAYTLDTDVSTVPTLLLISETRPTRWTRT